MAASEQSLNKPIYQLKVTLRGSSPAIWRRFKVPGNISLHELHLILQVVMGWTNSHLYRFEIKGTEFGEPNPESSLYGLQIKDAKRTMLKKVAPQEKAKFIYEYDFGDSWKHEIMVEKILPTEPRICPPVCLGGKGACPPEDCGGIWGYTELLEIVRNRGHKRHAEVMEWLGEQFDPEEFDLGKVNEWLTGFIKKDTQTSGSKIGRNDPCPCGSGKKYKKCCGR